MACAVCTDGKSLPTKISSEVFGESCCVIGAGGGPVDCFGLGNGTDVGLIGNDDLLGFFDVVVR